MHFILTTFKFVYVLSTHMSLAEIVEDETLKATRRRRKWENADYRGHLRSNEYDPLFDVYQNEHVIVQGVILQLDSTS